MTKFLRNPFKKIPQFVLVLIFLVLSSVIYFFNQGYYIGRNTLPSGDEPDYLVGAMKIKDYGGPQSIIKYLVTGTYTESRKHPFYMFLLSFFSEKSLDFFVYAKFFNFVLGGILLVSSFFILKRLFNSLAAVAFVFILLLNKNILSEASLVVPDTLMMLLVLFSFYFYYLGFKNEKVQIGNWVLGSLFSSLAYLTKPNGIFVIASFVMASFLIKKWSLFKDKRFYLAILAFFIFSSPLLIRNIVLYKNPFYNNNTSLLWIENRQERRSPEFNQKPPSFTDYFSKVTPLEEVKMYGENLVKMASNLSMLVLFDNWRWRYSLPLIFLAALSIFLDKDRNRKILLGVFFAVSYLFFAYNFRVSPHFRHLMPIIFIPVGFISLLFEKIKIGRISRIGIMSCVLAVLGLFISFRLLYTEARLTFRVFDGQVDLPAAHIAARDWLAINLKNEDVYIMGLDDNFMFLWYAPIQGSRIIQPYFASMSAFEQYLREKKVHFVVLGGQSVDSFREIYSAYFLKRKNTPDYLTKEADPVGWQLVLRFPYENEKSFKVLIYDVSGVWKNVQ